MSETAKKIHIPLGTRAYDIHIADGLFSQKKTIASLADFASGRRVMIVSDSNTGKLFGRTLRDSLLSAGAAHVSEISFTAGEKSKTPATLVKICRAAAKNKLDRSSLIAALGGGVTGDLAGFAASIYMRGIDFIQVPTSLLAMVDSSVGGKTGVDLPEGKNLIGTFHQPKAVFMDSAFLTSLPKSELSCGYAELIKHGVILDSKLFAMLETANPFKKDSFSPELLARSCRIKGSVVVNDEREQGQRALLNYGHTFGHAIEKAANFSTFSHGGAVAIGMAMAGTLALKRKLIKEDAVKRQNALLERYGLPVKIRGFKPEIILKAMYGDKKNLNGKIRLILPRRIGEAGIFNDVPSNEILEAIGAHCL